MLLAALAIGSDFEPSRSWLLAHAADLERLEPVQAIISPEAVVTAQRGGYTLDLEVRSGLNWDLAMEALKHIHAIDSEQAISALQHNVPRHSAGIKSWAGQYV